MKSCVISNISTVRSAINKASQPLQTGFSPALGADDTGCNCGGENGSTARGVRIGGSLSSGCEPNCGFSGDDRKILFVTASLRNVPEIFEGLSRCRRGKGPNGFQLLGIFPPYLMNREGILQV